MREQAFCAFHRRSGGTKKQKVHGTSTKALGPVAGRSQYEYVQIIVPSDILYLTICVKYTNHYCVKMYNALSRYPFSNTYKYIQYIAIAKSENIKTTKIKKYLKSYYCVFCKYYNMECY